MVSFQGSLASTLLTVGQKPWVEVEDTSDEPSLAGSCVILAVSIHADVNILTDAESNSVSNSVYDDIVVVLEEIDLSGTRVSKELLRLELDRLNPIPLVSRVYRLRIEAGCSR